jgi:hypothetical protein
MAFHKLGKNAIFLFLNDEKQMLSLNLSCGSNRTVCSMKKCLNQMRAKKIWLFLLDYVIPQCRILSNLKNILFFFAKGEWRYYKHTSK